MVHFNLWDTVTMLISSILFLVLCWCLLLCFPSHTWRILYSIVVLLPSSFIKTTGQKMVPTCSTFWRDNMTSSTKFRLENRDNMMLLSTKFILESYTVELQKQTAKQGLIISLWIVIVRWAAFIDSLHHMKSGDQRLDILEALWLNHRTISQARHQYTRGFQRNQTETMKMH